VGASAAFFGVRRLAVAEAVFFFGAAFEEAVFAFVPDFFAADFFDCGAVTVRGALSSGGVVAAVFFDFFGTGFGISRNRSPVSVSFARRIFGNPTSRCAAIRVRHARAPLCSSLDCHDDRRGPRRMVG
jgi:hypothetical protein